MSALTCLVACGLVGLWAYGGPRLELDKEAQNLLKWLATSQAAEDINSDDELAYEMILTPLVPAAATIDKVLEEANMAYESESQKECQDILDSIDDMLELESPKEKPFFSFDHNCPIEPLSNLQINSEYKRASDYHALHNTGTRNVSKDKRDKQWGSLPFTITDQVNIDGEHATLLVTHPFESETVDSAHSDYLNRNELRTDADHKVRAPERSLQTDSSASSSVQSSFKDDKVSGKYNCMDQSSYGSISSVQHGQECCK
ncbi:hypothetical protein VNO77_18397 [Canavalia gladiata]|uniref:Uncharacterized protein n=1 Tax=Canavalia gladiata TaxID=3824 RepID=A0AAN9LKM5_CANGL